MYMCALMVCFRCAHKFIL